MTLFIALLSTIYMCKKDIAIDNLINKEEPDRNQRPGPGGLLETDAEVSQQLVALSKAIVRLDHYNPATNNPVPISPTVNFRLKVHNYVIDVNETETSFGEIDQWAGCLTE